MSTLLIVSLVGIPLMSFSIGSAHTNFAREKNRLSVLDRFYYAIAFVVSFLILLLFIFAVFSCLFLAF